LTVTEVVAELMRAFNPYAESLQKSAQETTASW
jgi:hypothetical protein